MTLIVIQVYLFALGSEPPYRRWLFISVMPFSSEHPFNDLPGLPPPHELETLAVLKKLVGARAALASFAESIALLPNAEILTNALVLQEAKDSSEIENIVTTHDEIYRALVADSLFETPQTKEVRRYREALNAGFEALSKCQVINTPLLDMINSRLLVMMPEFEGLQRRNFKIQKLRKSSTLLRKVWIYCMLN